MNDPKKLSEYIIREALRLGADDADVMIVNSVNSSVKVRLGRIEELKQANPKSLGIRVFKQKRKALTFTSDFRKDSLRQLIGRTMEMAAVTTPDEFSGLPEREWLGIAPLELPGSDERLANLPTEKKIALAREMEELGMAKDPLIINSDGSSWSDGQTHYVLANSRGFYGEERYSSCSLSLSLVAEKDGVKQSDYWYSTARSLEKLDSVENVAAEAARRTVRKIGSRKPQTQKVPVVFDPIAGRDFLNIIASTVVGDAIYQRRSFLIDKLGQKIGVDGFTVVDDGLLADGLASRRFDDEGLPGRRNVVIENGILKSYLCDCYAARKLKLPPTGSASRGAGSEPSPGTSNFYLEMGPYAPEEIIASVKNGIYLTEVHWVGINYVTGDYSRGAGGIWIEDGKLTYPVQEFTIAGNMNEMLPAIEMIGNDLRFTGSICSPTFKIKELMISGS